MIVYCEHADSSGGDLNSVRQFPKGRNPVAITAHGHNAAHSTESLQRRNVTDVSSMHNKVAPPEGIQNAAGDHAVGVRHDAYGDGKRSKHDTVHSANLSGSSHQENNSHA
jgi:hypothetical protein